MLWSTVDWCVLACISCLQIHTAAANPKLSASPDQSWRSRCTLDYAGITPTITGGLHDFGEDLGVIGHGGSSTVRLFRRYKDNTLSAVKDFPPIPADSPRREALEECLKLEYEMGKLVSGHQGVAETQDLIHDPDTGSWSIASSYHSRSLAAEIWDLQTADVQRIFLEISNAVGYMHKRGIAYGDVKLENVLFDSAGHVKLVDFGSATVAGCLEADDPTINALPGDSHTPPYAPPESFESRTYDRQRADAWALGVLLYVMSAKELPWIRASNESVAWCRFAGVPESLHDTCAGEKQGPFEDRGHATCSSLAVPGASKVPMRLQGMLWGYLEADPNARLLPVGELLE